MNDIYVFDFDNTIYNGDSTLDFYRYCLKMNKRLFVYLPKQILGLIRYRLGNINKEEFKELFFSFLIDLHDIELIVDDFWKEHIHKIKDWYLVRNKEHDIIISASPEFLLTPISKYIDVQDIIATVIDNRTGKFYSKNCYGTEKVIRLKENYSGCNIKEFYSDSRSDEPLAKLAEKAFFVKKELIHEW